MLQNKYQKLRKKKKALQQLKAPKPEPEKQSPKKRVAEPKDAKEVAKKLLKSGAISAIKQDSRDKQCFKRSLNLEKRLSSSEKATVSGYQPFSQTNPGEDDIPSGPGPSARVGGPTHPPMKRLSDSFVSSRNWSERERPERDGRPERPRQGNTIYVRGYGITEDIIRNGFTTFGSIMNISMEVDKNCAFVTYEKMESAEKAISDLNGSMVSGIQLQVSLARRQPLIESMNESSSSASWSAIAASHSQKGSHRDKRELVTYEEP